MSFLMVRHTPNRVGFYLNASITGNKNKILTTKINAGFFKEVIGQGTVEKRNFGLLKGCVKN